MTDLCITCKHCLAQEPIDKTDRFHFLRCALLVAVQQINVVDGKPLDRAANTTCFAHRYKGACGIGAQFWESIPGTVLYLRAGALNEVFYGDLQIGFA
jgi:hypothetical protein